MFYKSATADTSQSAPLPPAPAPTVMPELVKQTISKSVPDIPPHIIELIQSHIDRLERAAKQFYEDKICVNSEQVLDIFLKSIKQGKSTGWHIARGSRITASKAWEISRGGQPDTRYRLVCPMLFFCKHLSLELSAARELMPCSSM